VGTILIRWSRGIVAAGLSVMPVIAASQTAPDGRPAFEAASIKTNPGGSGFQGGSCGGIDVRPGTGALAQMAGVRMTPPPPDTCQFTNVTLQMLMATSYALGITIAAGPDPIGLAGAPPWFNTAHFDILAKTVRPTTNAQLMLMMQRMLEERFALKFHRETREADGFALVVTPGGPKMTKGNAGGGRIGRFGPNPWTATNTSMDELARFLGLRLGKPVADATGLPGGYNFTLVWTPGDGERSGFPPLPPGVTRPPSADPVDGPSLFTALQEQLGLRLERRRVPTEVIVVDGARSPTPN